MPRRGTSTPSGNATPRTPSAATTLGLVATRPEPGETLVRDSDSHVVLHAEHEHLGLTASRFANAGAAPSPPDHVHDGHAEAFLVREGTMRFLLESGEVTASPETWVVVPPWVVHTFRLDGPAAFLDAHVPSRGYGAFVRALTSAADAQELDRARAAFDQHPPTPGGGVDPSTVIVARAGGDDGETITDRPGRRVTLLVDRDELALTETVYGPGEAGPDPHVHHDHVDAFVVLEGGLTFTLRSGELYAPAGTFVLVPPDVVHTFRNAGDADARFFNLHAPSCGFGDHLRGRNPGFDQHVVGDDVAGGDPETI